MRYRLVCLLDDLRYCVCRLRCRLLGQHGPTCAGRDDHRSPVADPEVIECGRQDLVLVGATWTPHRCTRLRHWRGRHLLEPVGERQHLEVAGG